MKLNLSIMKEVKSGIYKIQNKINNKVYIGSSWNLDKRFYEHVNTLGNKTHFNKHLQRAWNKYGPLNFSFEILEEVEVPLLMIKEKEYMVKYGVPNFDLGYNIRVEPDSNKGATWKLSEYTCLKMAESRKKKILQYTLKGVFVKEWKSSKEVEEYYNISSCGVRACCLGKRCKAAGFMWRDYTDNYSLLIDRIERVNSMNLRKISQFTLEGKFIKEWDNMEDVLATFPYKKGGLYKCCKGFSPFYLGFIWRYNNIRPIL